MTNVTMVDIDYRQIGPTTLAVWRSEFERVSSPLLPHAEAMWTAAGPHSALALAKMWLENQYATTGIIIRPEDNNPLSMRPWIEDPTATREGIVIDWRNRKKVGTVLNSRGEVVVSNGVIKVPVYCTGAILADDKSMMLRFESPDAAVREWRRRIIDDRNYKDGVYNDKRTLADMLNTYAPPGDVHPETGVDNANIGYPRVVSTMLRRYQEAEGTIPPEEVPSMAEYPVNWPGVPGGPIIFSFPVHLNIVPAWRTRQRSGIKARRPRAPIQHENGARNSGARSDSMYLFNGAEGRSASWHASVDHKEGYANLPGDEVGWQAGDGSGPGNMTGFAIELCQLAYTMGATTWRQARRNAAEMMGRVACARLGAPLPPKQHANFMRKNCPEFLRSNQGWWNTYVDDVEFFRSDELARMAGGQPVPQPEPEIIYVGDTLKTIVPLNLRQRASTSAPVITTLPIGTEIVVNGLYESADGYGWLPVTTPAGNGVVAHGDANGLYIEKIASAPPPEPEPEYVDAVPIPALLETDLQKWDTATGIITDDTGHDFVFVADVIEFTAETVAGEFAVENPRPVKVPYQVGERAIAAWLVENQAGVWHYVLAGGDDEWIRVPYANTKRISDAPLLPGDEELAEDLVDIIEDALD